jgi:hypothetical protein
MLYQKSQAQRTANNATLHKQSGWRYNGVSNGRVVSARQNEHWITGNPNLN